MSSFGSDADTRTYFVNWVVNYMDPDFLVDFADSSVRVGIDKLFPDLPFDGYLPVQVTMPTDIDRKNFIYNWAKAAMVTFGGKFLQILKINFPEGDKVTIHIGNFTAISPYAKTEIASALDWKGNATNQAVVKQVNESVFGPMLQTCFENKLKANLFIIAEVLLNPSPSMAYNNACSQNKSKWASIEETRALYFDTNSTRIQSYEFPKDLKNCKITFQYYSGIYEQDLYRLTGDKIDIIFDKFVCPVKTSDTESFLKKMFLETFQITKFTQSGSDITVTLGQQANGLQVVASPNGQDKMLNNWTESEIKKVFYDVISSFVYNDYPDALQGTSENAWDTIFASGFKVIFDRANQLFNDTEQAPSFQNFLVQSTAK